MNFAYELAMLTTDMLHGEDDLLALVQNRMPRKAALDLNAISTREAKRINLLA